MASDVFFSEAFCPGEKILPLAEKQCSYKCAKRNTIVLLKSHDYSSFGNRANVPSRPTTSRRVTKEKDLHVRMDNEQGYVHSLWQAYGWIDNEDRC